MGGGIAEIVDEILNKDERAGGLAINWQGFGSNGHEKADYSRGVLERFTRHASNSQPININGRFKTISNPRKIQFLSSPHHPFYFEGIHLINERGNLILNFEFINPVSVEKIAVNHYLLKSREEYIQKLRRGAADGNFKKYETDRFNSYDLNDEYDDGILRYRDARAKTFQLPDKSRATERLFNALAKNLSPMILPRVSQSFYMSKIEVFLTCRATAEYLRIKRPNDERLKIYEEASLEAVLKSLGGMTLADARLLLSELPNLLSLPYPVVKDLRESCLDIIPQIMDIMRLNNLWKDYVELDYLRRLLQVR